MNYRHVLDKFSKEHDCEVYCRTNPQTKRLVFRMNRGRVNSIMEAPIFGYSDTEIEKNVLSVMLSRIEKEELEIKIHERG